MEQVLPTPLYSIKTLVLNTSRVTNMASMFYGASALIMEAVHK